MHTIVHHLPTYLIITCAQIERKIFDSLYVYVQNSLDENHVWALKVLRAIEVTRVMKIDVQPFLFETDTKTSRRIDRSLRNCTIVRE